MKRANSNATIKERKKIKQEIKVDQMDLGPVPRALNVTEFVEARQYEIKAMEDALKNEGQFAGALRVFQTVKRHMRRRAASVNVKRLPMKFRQRALAQMAKDPVHARKKPLSRKARRKPKRLLAEILSRPGSKRWLETHIWHAKRMKMVDRWGLKLALHPNQKGIRFAYKSVKNEAMMHDKSYQKVLEIRGTENLITDCFSKIADPTVPSLSSAQFLNGKKQGTIMLHEALEYPLKTVAQIQFLWKPIENNSKERVLWIWVHSNQYRKVFDLLVKTFQQNDEFKSDPDAELQPTSSGNCIVIPHHLDLIRLEFSGPRSHAVLQTCLTLAKSGVINEEAHHIWQTMSNLPSASCIPPGVVLGLTIEDPRVCFPKLLKKRTESDYGLIDRTLTQAFQNWPEGLQISVIWDEDVRQKTISGKRSNAEIQQDRKKNLIPGTPLEPLPSDVKIPILLIRRGFVGEYSTEDYSEAISGWDLVAPKSWAMPLWNLMVYAGVRVGGLRERDYGNFEAGLPAYPHDYPETKTFVDDINAEAKKKQDKFKRTPISKRVKYEQKGVLSPFRPPFENLIGLNGKETPVDVIHSERVVKILETELIAKHKSFEAFAKEFVNQLKELTKFRKISLRNLDSIVCDKLFCRVRLISKTGLGSPHAMIHLESDEKDDFELDKHVRHDKVIGYTTSGGYSFSEGKSVAIGACTLSGLHNLFQRSEGAPLVFVRTTTGRKSHQAQLTLTV